MKKFIVAVQDYRYSFHVLMGGIVLSIAFYMFCVSAAVHSAMIRNNTLHAVSELQAEVSDLETRYIAATNNMTLDTASAMGLTEPQNKIFISKAPKGAALSINR